MSVSFLENTLPVYLQSPMIVYGWRHTSNRFFVVEAVNSLNEVFVLIKQKKNKVISDVLKDIETAKYPLTVQEISTVFDKIRLQLAINKGYRMEYREADQFFHSQGIYFRLGLVHAADHQRYEILRAYSRLYGFKFAVNEWTTLDLKEFQRLADLGYSLVEISQVMLRSYDDLRAAAKKFQIEIARKKRVYQKWTEADHDILRKYVGVKTFEQIQQEHFPERKMRDVMMCAGKLGLSARKKRLANKNAERRKAVKNDM